MFVDNHQHADTTVVLVVGEKNRHGLLMELASALTGAGVRPAAAAAAVRLLPGADCPTAVAAPPSGLNTRRAIITSCADPEECAGLPRDIVRDKNTLVFSFHVTDSNGHKLDYSRASGVLYTLGLLLGHGSQTGPLSPPQPVVVRKLK